MAKFFTKKIAIGLLLGALAMGGYGLAYATSDGAVAAPGSEPILTACNGMAMDFSFLVDDGVIDQATAGAISAYQTQKAAEFLAEVEQMQELTEEERQVYLENNKDRLKTDPFAAMVNVGIITQTQADSIKENMPAPKEVK